MGILRATEMGASLACDNNRSGMAIIIGCKFLAVDTYDVGGLFEHKRYNLPTRVFKFNPLAR